MIGFPDFSDVIKSFFGGFEMTNGLPIEKVEKRAPMNYAKGSISVETHFDSHSY